MTNRDELLRAIRTAASYQEQARLVAELDAQDRQMRTTAAQDRQIELADAVIESTFRPTAVHELHTAATDWLGEAEASIGDDAEQRVVAEAAMWFKRTSPEVKADGDEFFQQARGIARRVASAYGEQAPSLEESFVAYAEFLNRKQGASGLDQVQQLVNPHEDPKQTPLPTDVFDNFAPPVDPINEGVSGTEPSTRAPLLQEIESNGGEGGGPEKPGGHSTSEDTSGSYSEVEPEDPMAHRGSLEEDPWRPSLAISHVATLDQFREEFAREAAARSADPKAHRPTPTSFGSSEPKEAASQLDQVQQVVDNFENPDPKAMPTDVMFPWTMDDQDAYADTHPGQSADTRTEVKSAASRRRQLVASILAKAPAKVTTPEWQEVLAFARLAKGDDFADHFENEMKGAEGQATGEHLWEGMAKAMGFHDSDHMKMEDQRNAEDDLRKQYAGQPGKHGRDENSDPYYEVKHPHGWTIRNHGGPNLTIGHVATPGEEHDAINVGHVDESGHEAVHPAMKSGSPEGNHHQLKRMLNDWADNYGSDYTDSYPGTSSSKKIQQYKRHRGITASVKTADQWTAPHGVPGPQVANSPASTPEGTSGTYSDGYQEGRSDALSGGREAPTYADASSAVPEFVRGHTQGYSDAMDEAEKAMPKDVPGSMGGQGAQSPGSDAQTNPNADPQGRAYSRKISSLVSIPEAYESADFVKAMKYAQKWKPGTPLVSEGTAEFEAGLYAGMSDNLEHQAAWVDKHVQLARKDAVFGERMMRHAFISQQAAKQLGLRREGSYLRQAATSTDLDTGAPQTSPSPTGQTPINGPGQPGPLAGQEDAAAPGGPAPYNGAPPFGTPVVPTGVTRGTGGNTSIDTTVGGPMDQAAVERMRQGPRQIAFRRQVQAGIVRNNQRRSA